jgi:shikimate kinase
VLAELTGRDNVVLATGGGAVLAEQNREHLRRGIVVYLQASIDTLLARTQRDRSRPLLQDGDRRAKFEHILREREALYRAAADIVVGTDQRSPQAVAQEIAAKLRELNDANA